MLKSLSRRFRRPIFLMMLAVPLSGSLAACQTVSIEIACKAYGKGATYSGTKDTHQTVRGIQVKNKTFADLGCKL